MREKLLPVYRQSPLLTRITLLGAFGTVFLALMGLFGYLPGLQVLASFNDVFIPMAPSTAICFILLTAIPVVHLIPRLQWSPIVPLLVVLSGSVALFGALEVIGYYCGIDLNFEETLMPTFGTLGEIPIGRMSPATGAVFFIAGLSGIALLVKLRNHIRGDHFGHAAGITETIVVLTSLVFCLAYLFGAPLLYGAGSTIPMALTTALAFFFLGLSLVTTGGAQTFPLNIIMGESTKARMMRLFLPLVALAVLLGILSYIGSQLIPSANPVLLSASLVILMLALTGMIVNFSIGRLSKKLDSLHHVVRKSESKLLEAQYITRLGYFSWEIGTDSTTWSNGMYKLLKYELDDQIDFKTINSDIHHPDDLVRVTKWLTDGIESGNVILTPNEYRLICKDEEVLWVQTNGRFEHEDGKAVRLFGTCQNITERKQTEMELKDSERKHQAWVENSPVCTKILDVDFNLQYMSSSGIIGLNIDDINEYYGKPYPLHFYPDSFKIPMRANLKESKETGEIITQEASVLNVDGNVLWYQSTIIPVNDERGELDYMMVVSLETTERKQAEENLSKAQSLLRDTEKTGKIGGWEFNPETMEQRWTDEVFQILEIEATDGAPKVPDGLNFIAPSYRPMAEKAIRKAIELGEPYDQEWKVITEKGNPKWVHSVARVIKEDDHITSIRGSFQDITERKKAEEAQIESEEKFRSYIENAPDGIFIANEKGEYLEVNQAACRITGYSEKELLQLTIPELTQQEYLEQSKNQFQTLIKSGFVRAERGFLTKSGEKRFWTVDAVKLSDTRFLGFAKDITERKHIEIELEEYRTHLEEIVAERTKKLETTNRELEAQGKKIRQADKLKTEFLANMSHELRTPLNAITTLSHILIKQTKERLSDDENSYLEIVERNGKQLLTLINDILDLSRIEANKMVVSPRRISVELLLQLVKDNLLILSQTKGLHFNLHFPDKVPLVETDKTRLYQVLMNIIGNAVKFTEVGGINISVKYNEKELSIIIKDSGIGMSKEALPEIFDEFIQVDGTLARQYEGTGLGLAIAKKTMKMLGGEITVKSLLGEGSTFTVTIPLLWHKNRDLDDETSESIAVAQPSSKEKEETGTLPRVLIIEDNPDNMISIQAILNGKCTLFGAIDGETGLEIATTQQLDLILLDISLPGMDGEEVLRHLKADETTKNISVIAVTAQAMRGDRTRFIKMGFDSYVSKPIDIDTLLHEIDTLT